jgi:hypothetical protein
MPFQSSERGYSTFPLQAQLPRVRFTVQGVVRPPGQGFLSILTAIVEVSLARATIHCGISNVVMIALPRSMQIKPIQINSAIITPVKTAASLLLIYATIFQYLHDAKCMIVVTKPQHPMPALPATCIAPRVEENARKTESSGHMQDALTQRKSLTKAPHE